MKEMRIHGFGGQGTVTLAELIASAAMRMGKEVQTLPFFGVERRGAAVRAALRVSDEEILIRSQVNEADLLIVLSPKLLDLAIGEGIRPEGGIILNTAIPVACDYPVYTLDATGIALGEGLVANGDPYVNIPLFGGVCRVLAIPKELIGEVLAQKWPGKTGLKNARAAEIGYEAVQF